MFPRAGHRHGLVLYENKIPNMWCRVCVLPEALPSHVLKLMMASSRSQADKV